MIAENSPYLHMGLNSARKTWEKFYFSAVFAIKTLAAGAVPVSQFDFYSLFVGVLDVENFRLCVLTDSDPPEEHCI